MQSMFVCVTIEARKEAVVGISISSVGPRNIRLQIRLGFPDFNINSTISLQTDYDLLVIARRHNVGCWLSWSGSHKLVIGCWQKPKECDKVFKSAENTYIRLSPAIDLTNAYSSEIGATRSMIKSECLALCRTFPFRTSSQKTSPSSVETTGVLNQN